MLGEIKSIEPTPYGQCIKLRHMRSPLFIRTQLLERARKSHRSAFTNMGEARRVGLFVVERTSRGNLVVQDLAVLLTNQAYIPADSTHEVVMADHLIASERKFYKPLNDGKEAVLPDFVLTDEIPHICIEVLGMLGQDDYDHKWAAKQAYYRATSTPVISWNTSQPLPSFRA